MAENNATYQRNTGRAILIKAKDKKQTEDKPVTTDEKK